MCSIRIYIFDLKKTTNITRRQIAKETKEEMRTYVENLTEYDDIVCEFPLCTFNLLDQVVNFSCLFIRI